MKKSSLAILLLIMAAAGFCLAIVSYSFFYVEGAREYNASIMVGDHIGFNTDNTSVAFGMVMPGSSSSARFIKLSNKKDYPIKAEFSFSGDIARWIKARERRALLQPGEEKKIRLSADVPASVEYGNYTGKVRITFTRALWNADS